LVGKIKKAKKKLKQGVRFDKTQKKNFVGGGWFGPGV
jgi:hypothetical protein